MYECAEDSLELLERRWKVWKLAQKLLFTSGTDGPDVVESGRARGYAKRLRREMAQIGRPKSQATKTPTTILDEIHVSLQYNKKDFFKKK